MQTAPNSTVRDVIITVLQSQDAPRPTKSILKQILEQKLYDFDTDHPSNCKQGTQTTLPRRPAR